MTLEWISAYFGSTTCCLEWDLRSWAKIRPERWPVYNTGSGEGGEGEGGEEGGKEGRKERWVGGERG